MMTQTPLLEVENLEVQYRMQENVRAVNDVSLSLDDQEYMGIIGESGSGKSTVAKAILGGLDHNGEIVSGTIRYKGEEIQDLTSEELAREIRWKEISYIPQAAMNNLDPLLRISDQATQIAKSHTDWSTSKAVEELEELFEIVGLPPSRVHDYPHQFSGGMKQRVIIALALLLEPSLIIADEPTTALDVIMQDQVLEHMARKRDLVDIGMILITHDISVVFDLCDTMTVMHGGQVAETGTTEDVFDHSRHPYSYLLQRAFPDIRHPDRELVTIDGQPPRLHQEVDFCTFADRCPWERPACRDGAPALETFEGDGRATSCIRHEEIDELHESDRDTPLDRDQTRSKSSRQEQGNQDPILELRNVSKHFLESTGVVDDLKLQFFGGSKSRIRAVDGVNLSLGEMEAQGIIGESGCGKSTLLEVLMGLYEPTHGEIFYRGDPLSEFDRNEWMEYRRNVQIIFQDPFEVMNPKYTVWDALAEPLEIHGISKDEWEDRIHTILEQVQLTPASKYVDRAEGELSGGEKQRIAIARALILEPDLILADEPVSMLDVSTQAEILQLLNDLIDEFNVSLFYISHDLSTVPHLCDRTNVMYLGRIVESAGTEALLEDPQHPYTEELLRAIPVPDPHLDRERTRLEGAATNPSDLPTGCRFKDRCPERMDICETPPEFDAHGDDPIHQVACHLYYDHEESMDEIKVTGDME